MDNIPSLVKNKRFQTAIVVILIIIIVYIIWRKVEGFISPDGVIARKTLGSVRSDTNVDRSWNLSELEKTVALINANN